MVKIVVNTLVKVQFSVLEQFGGNGCRYWLADTRYANDSVGAGWNSVLYVGVAEAFGVNHFAIFADTLKPMFESW